MIPAPITVFPAGGRVPAAQAAAPSGGAVSAFGALLDDVASSEGVALDVPEVEVVSTEDEPSAEDSGSDLIDFHLIAAEVAPLPVVPRGGGGLAVLVTEVDEDAGWTDGWPADSAEVDGDRTVSAKAPSGPEVVTMEPVEIGDAVSAGPIRAEAAVQEGGEAKPLVSMAESSAMLTMPTASAQTLSVRGESPIPPPVAPPVTRQVADAILNIKGDSTEIVLNPPELGVVRIVISRDPQGLMVTLLAERPEALDLMRRHVDLLRQDLAAQGEEGARLDFASPGQGEGFAQGGREDAQTRLATVSGGQVAASDQIETMARPVLMPGRLDIRL